MNSITEVLDMLIKKYPERTHITISPENLAMLIEELGLDPTLPINKYKGKGLKVSLHTEDIELI